MAKTGPGSGCLCCCCVITWLIKIILTIIFLFGLALLFFWIIVNPHKMKIKVNEASLARFNFTDSDHPTLHFHLDFVVTYRNPNRIMGFYYDVTVRAYYQEKYYVDSDWQEFYQGHKNTTVMRFSFDRMQEVYFLDSNERSRFIKQFNQDKRAGVIPINVKIEDFRVRVKLGRIRIGIFQPKVHCHTLEVPLNDNGKGNSSVRSSGSVNCGVQFKVTSLLEPLD